LKNGDGIGVRGEQKIKENEELKTKEKEDKLE